MKNVVYTGPNKELLGETALALEGKVAEGFINVQFDKLGLTDYRGRDLSHHWHVFPKKHFQFKAEEL